MADQDICPHCHTPIKIRNQSGYCDHLHYPESCTVCARKPAAEAWGNRKQIMIDKALGEFLKEFVWRINKKHVWAIMKHSSYIPEPKEIEDFLQTQLDKAYTAGQQAAREEKAEAEG